jgi:hypothetical protein
MEINEICDPEESLSYKLENCNKYNSVNFLIR